MNKADRLKDMFMSDVDALVSQPELLAKDPSRNFTRNRKLSAKDVLLFLILRERDTTNRELLKYFEYSIDTPSLSSYFQQRRNADGEAVVRRISKNVPSDFTTEPIHIKPIYDSGILNVYYVR